MFNVLRDEFSIETIPGVCVLVDLEGARKSRVITSLEYKTLVRKSLGLPEFPPGMKNRGRKANESSLPRRTFGDGLITGTGCAQPNDVFTPIL